MREVSEEDNIFNEVMNEPLDSVIEKMSIKEGEDVSEGIAGVNDQMTRRLREWEGVVSRGECVIQSEVWS
jgi:hypothetical protein